MSRKTIHFSLALSLLAPLPAALAEDAMHGAKHTDTKLKDVDAAKLSLLRASEIIGKDIYNDAGEDLGDVHELVLSGDQNKISYAVISFGGWMGIGDKLFAVPFTQLQHKSLEKDKIYVNLSKEKLKNAPGFDKNAWPDKTDSDYWKQVNQFYSSSEVRRDGLPTDDRAVERGRGVDPTVRDTTVNPGRTDDRVARDATNSVNPGIGNARDDARQIPWNRKVSQIIAGADVETPTGDNVGDITDLVIDRNGDVRYAVMSHGGVLGMGDKLFAVPMSALRGQHDDEQFTMNVTKDQFKNAPGFEKNSWPNFADPQWRESVDRFYGLPAQARTE